MSTPPGLGPHAVGQRVVVRRVLPGETGPSGGPAMTDVLGVLESWTPPVLTVRPADGDVVEIPVADVVSGKPVPPRPSVRHRVPAEEAERRATSSWVPVESAPLGSWLLRASGGYTTRANSVLAAGSPDRPVAAALEEVCAFYRARDLPPVAQVVCGSGTEAELVGHGWVPARPGEDDTCFQLASVAQALRAVRRTPVPGVEVELSPTVTAAWWAADDRSRAHGETARAVLEGSPAAAFAVVTDGGRAVAMGRIAGATDEVDDWAGVTTVWVDEAYRRRGLGSAVMAALLEWAAEHGVATVFLQVRGDNAPALAAYERLGFRTHHTYRYLRPARPDSGR